MIHEPVRKTEEAEQATGSGRSVDVKGALAQHWKKGLAVMLAVIVLGTPIAWVKGKARYRAEGVIYISPHNWRNLDADEEQEIQSNSQFREYMEQQAHTINRYDIVLPVIQGDAPGAKFFRARNESDRRAADRLRGALQIAAVPDTYQMTVALEGPKAAGLAEVINSVMDHYVQVARKEMFYDSDSRLKNLYDEREHIQSDVAETVAQRDQIAEKLGTTLFNGGVINNYEKAAGINADALMSARHERMAAEAAMGGTQAGGEVEQSIEASAADQAQHDPVLSSYRSVLGARRAELLMQIQGLAPKHAGRIAAEKDIAAIDAEMEQASEEARKVAAANLRSMQRGKIAQSSQLEQDLKHEADEIQARANLYMRNYQEAINLGDELDRLRKRLNATEDRISTLQLEVKAPGSVRIFSPAMTPELPVAGGRKKLLMIVLVLAAVLALAVPVAVHFLDPAVRSARELEAVLGLPVTGWLPCMPKSIPETDEVIRLAVVVRRHLKELRSGALVVSALKHGSGSSTICLGMGKALNKLGVRTLVVEVNPKTPDSRYQTADERPGFAQWMSCDVELAQCIAGETPDLPARIATGEGAQELSMMSGHMSRLLIEEARKEFDLILIDAAPLPTSLLTEELIREYDAVMMVSLAQVDKRKEIQAAMKTIEHLRPRTFGSVINKVNSRKADHDTAAVLAA